MAAARILSLKEAAKMTGLRPPTLKDLDANDFFTETQSVGDGKILVFPEAELATVFAGMLERKSQAEADAKEQSEAKGDEGSGE